MDILQLLLLSLGQLVLLALPALVGARLVCRPLTGVLLVLISIKLVVGIVLASLDLDFLLCLIVLSHSFMEASLYF